MWFWTEGLLGSTQSFVHNEGLARWEDATTGSPTTEDIGQAEQFALSLVQSRPTQWPYVYLPFDTNSGTRGTFTPKCERKRRCSLLLKTHPYLSIRELTQGDTP